MAATARGLEPVVTSDVRAMPGRGIRGNADGQPMAAGNSALMSDLGWSLAPALGKRAQVAGGERSFRDLCRVGGAKSMPCLPSTTRHFPKRVRRSKTCTASGCMLRS